MAASPQDALSTACDEAERLAGRYRALLEGWQQTIESLKTCTEFGEYQRRSAVADALQRDVQTAREDFFKHRREHGC